MSLSAHSLARNPQGMNTPEANNNEAATPLPEVHESPRLVIDEAMESTYGSLDESEERLKLELEKFGWTEEVIHFLSLGFREAAANAIKHGHKEDAARKVRLHFEISAQELLIEIEDEGSGFDPAGVPDPMAKENLLKTSGRGIAYMRQFYDDVQFSFPRGTKVRLKKSRSVSPKQD